MERVATDFITIPDNPVPTGGRCFFAMTSDGSKLRVATFPSAAGVTERANILLVTGRSEFIEKYFEVVTELQTRGYGVTLTDWRGQGLSSRLLAEATKGHINNFDTFVSDLRSIDQTVVKKEFSTPTILMSHSMGGVPALQLLASGENGYDGFVAAVLSAPMTRLFPSSAKRTFARALARAAVRAGFGTKSLLGVKEYSLEFEGNALTSDPKRHARFLALQTAAPNAMIFSPTYGWLKAAIDAIDQIHDPEFMKSLKTPVLIISAEKDLLIDSTDHPELAVANELIQCITLKNALHEILMEQDHFRQQFWDAFDGFINPKLDANA